MGSQSKINLAYIAGFLDGDGSLMFQVKKRKDGNRSGRRFMVTICFYQDSRHDEPLDWIRSVFKVGYISKRNDGMTELRINGFRRVATIIKVLLPFIRFKKIQAKVLLESALLLQHRDLSEKDLRKLVSNILIIQSENYVTKKKRTKEDLLKVLDLTP